MQRRFWTTLIVEGQKKSEIKKELIVSETVDRMLTDVHGLIVLQMLKPTAKCRTWARDTIEQMIDGLASP